MANNKQFLVAIEKLPAWAQIALTIQDTVGTVYGAKAAGTSLGKFASENKLINNPNVILNTPKGQRPDPSTYLSKEYIDNHLALFDEGAVRFTSNINYKKDGTYGNEEAFVMPKSKFEIIMIESKGNLSIVGQKLNLDKGYLSGSDTLIVYIEKNDISGLKLPSGNEPGANSYWKTGGYTSGGTAKAIIKLSNKPKVTVLDIQSLRNQLKGDKK